MMNTRTHPNTGNLPDEIRRQFGSHAMTRYAQSLEAFSAPVDTDDRFALLLAKLESAECRRPTGR